MIKHDHEQIERVVIEEVLEDGALGEIWERNVRRMQEERRQKIEELKDSYRRRAA
jgi:hypothetical protein